MNLDWLQIDADIRSARTLPSRAYVDPALHERVAEAVFAPSWQFVGDAESVRVPGFVRPVTMLPGLLDEPIVLSRDREDRLHCLSNVCTHRANLVVDGAGVCQGLRCRYHGRRFGLDGSFVSMPEFEEAVDFPQPSDDLPRLALESWNDLLFASIAPGVPFDAIREPLERAVGWVDPSRFRFDASRSRDYIVASSWILYCENYLEGFHIPFVHAGLAEEVDYGSYRTELFDGGCLQLAHGKKGKGGFEPPAGSPYAEEGISAYYFWFFPNLMLNFYPWGLSINVVEPLGVDRTRVRFLAYVGDERKLDTGAGAELDRVEREDEAIVEACQRGMRSRLYDAGRYSPAREQGVHHFHRLLVDAIKAS